MIILNNNLEIVYPFNIERVLNNIIKPLLLKRAYQGYVYYNTLDDKENTDYYSIEDFSNLELWKIKFSFQIYLERVRNINPLGFNPSNTTLIKQLFKDLFKK